MNPVEYTSQEQNKHSYTHTHTHTHTSTTNTYINKQTVLRHGSHEPGWVLRGQRSRTRLLHDEVVVEGDDHDENEEEEEDQESKVDVGHHSVPVGHLLLRGGEGDGGVLL